ncbi:hypothetical protein KEM52_006376 [Ascosphaera acerosa]|nr:hypothetical protein KEM52_006376 [Ascosphaera acerosa]
MAAASRGMFGSIVRAFQSTDNESGKAAEAQATQESQQTPDAGAAKMPVDPYHIQSESDFQDLQIRMTYDMAFLNFTAEDGDLIHSTKELLAPAVPAIVDDVYVHLLKFDTTAKAFTAPQTAATEKDKNVATTISELSLDHPNIQLRKDFLKGYLVRLVSNTNWAADSSFWSYLDKVGLMHTGNPGFKHREKRPELYVELQHCALLLGWVVDTVIKFIMGLDAVDNEKKTRLLTAFSKLIWLQNDLFLRHYVTPRA